MEIDDINILKETIPDRPFILAIAGGTASGKTTFTHALSVDSQIQDQITVLGMDNFYIGCPEGVNADDYDFDHPSSLDFDAINKCLRDLLIHKETQMPLYDFKTHKPSGKFETLKCKDILIFEGIMSLYDEKIRNIFDLKLFVLCDSDVALARRILRDIKDRGRDVNEVLTRYNKFIK